MSGITPEELGKLFTDPKDWDDEWRNGGYRDALSQATTMVKIEHGKFLERLRIIKLLEVWWETDQELEELIDIIKGENNG